VGETVEIQRMNYFFGEKGQM